MFDLTAREWGFLVIDLLLIIGFLGTNIEISYLKRRRRRLEPPASGLNSLAGDHRQRDRQPWKYKGLRSENVFSPIGDHAIAPLLLREWVPGEWVPAVAERA